MLDVANRLRDARGKARWWWLSLAAVVMGGGIWAMHFVAMLSYDIGLPVRYDLELTIASLWVAVLVTGLGLVTVGGGVKLTRLRLAGGGLLMGLGVAAMHYVGMAAMRMDATIHYDPKLFALSVVIAIVAATAALWLAFNVHAQWQKLLSAAVMAVAVSGMHFVGMAAAEYHFALLTPLFSLGGISPDVLAALVAGTTFLLLLLGLFSSIVDRRISMTSALAAHRIEISNRRYRSLIRNSSDVIAIIDGRGRFVYCSESAKRILGFAPTWLIGRRLDEFMSPAELGQFYAFLVDVQAEPGLNKTTDLRLRHADGQWRAFEIICCNLRDDPGIGGIVANLRDMTDRQRALDELRAAKEEADFANASKSAFLAAMSHELRTPLNAIIGFSEVIGSGMLGQEAGPRALEYAKHIQDSGKHLLSLINDILDLSKAEAGKMTLLEDYMRPADVAADSLRIVGAQHGEGEAVLEVAVPRDLPYLYGDRRRIRQALINVLSNAFKFTHAGGRISFSGSLDPGDAQGGGKGDLLFVVKDSGIGMSAADVAIALEPFRQIDSRLSRKYEGTGLGLPLTKRLMELHGGRLEIDSALDIGTTVTLRFPAARLHRTYSVTGHAAVNLAEASSDRARKRA